jgi:hypothetical protein
MPLTLRIGGKRIAVLLGLVIAVVIFAQAYASDPLNLAGYLDFSYGTTVVSAPTGEKPESKLWFHDSYWWGVLWNETASEYQIYKLDWASQSWQSTNVAVDNRATTKADALWDGTKLYIASHVYAQLGKPNQASDNSARLYRFSYDTGSKTYSLDGSFPVTINSHTSENLVLDKDSTGRLWVTFVSEIPGSDPLAPQYSVYINYTTLSSDDTSWATPVALMDVTGIDTAAQVLGEDISSLIAFADQVGVMWSNQITGDFHFAYHAAAHPSPVSNWTLETLDPGSYGYKGPNDHINLAKTSDGKVFAAVKTDKNTAGTDPVIMLFVRSAANTFTSHTISTFGSADTRPVVLVHEDENKVYVVYVGSESGGAICYNSSSLASISFSPLNCQRKAGSDAPLLIASDTYIDINNPTSTKQNLTDASGLVVLASDDTTAGAPLHHVYVHGVLGGSSVPTPTPSPTPSETPTETPLPSEDNMVYLPYVAKND